ncbi:MAG: hypothetical protein K2Y21_11130 [Phycisphaerales bacterium]|nr:hypothetical protein [Phycisphaerales bacterium]
MIIGVLLASLATKTFAGFERQPTGVTIEIDGNCAVSFAQSVQPDSETAPLYSTLPDGSVIRGVRVTNSDTMRSRHVNVWYPGYLVLLQNGEWKIGYVNFATECVGLMPSESMVIPGSENIRLMVSEDAGGVRLRPFRSEAKRVPSVTWSYSHANAPAYAADLEFWIRDIIQRSVDSYVNRMGQQFFNVSFEITWESLEPGAFARSLIAGRRSIAWPTLRDEYWRPNILGEADDYEERLYSALPPGSNIRYFWATSSVATTSQVFVPIPLEVEWLGSSAGVPMRIELNRNAAFDVMASYKGKPDAGLKDLEATIVHEFGHHFGFRSEATSADSFFYNFVSAWDIFRMNDNNENGVTDNRFSFEPRELRLGVQSLAALDVVPAGLPIAFRLANNENGGSPNGQPSHWWGYQASDEAYIGIMRTSGLPGNTEIANGTYLQPADIKAFDVIGYKIRFFQQPAAVTPPMNVVPATNAVIDGAPLLSWGSVPAASFYNAVVYDLGPNGTGTPELVWGLAFLSNQPTRLPGTVLLPSHHYEWRAVAQNTYGSAAASTRFTTSATHCPVDLDNSGLVDDADFQLFVGQYDALDCFDPAMPENCSGDFNLDTFVDDADFAIFVVAYDNLGCF